MASQRPCSEKDIAHYTCRRAAGPITIDGRLDEPSWQKAEKSPRFVDMATGEPAWFDTRAAAVWDDECLYIGFWLEEPFVRARHTRRDALIFQENDVEVFIDGGDAYYEFEINALGTIYEVFFIWQDAYHKGSRFDVPEFDLLSRKALSFGGNEDRDVACFWSGQHPRGVRWAFLDWDFPGLRTAVHVDGKINDDTVVDRGWSVELAFPWDGMQWLANGRSLPPQAGDTWRLFLGRFELLKSGGGEVLPHPAWSWNRHGAYDTHLPECFTYFHFSDAVVGE
jgi:hypothetical protein